MARTKLPYRPIGGVPAPEGVGGWLALLVFFLGVLMPLGQLNSIRMLLGAAEVLEPRYGDTWGIFSTSLVTVIAIKTALYLFVAWRLIYRKLPSTPRVAIIVIWLTLVLLGVASLTVGAIFSPDPYPYDVAAGQMIWPVLISAVATAYLLRSKRVANTYRNRSDGSELAAVFE